MRGLIFTILSLSGTLTFAQGYIWSLPFNSSYWSNVGRICASSTGTIYSTGSTTGTTDFDPGPGASTVTSAGTAVYIVKQQTSGTFKWVIPIIASSQASGTGLTLDKAEHVYVCGAFNGTADFDPGPGTYSMNSQTYNDGYVCKYDSSGQLIWARQFGEAGQVYCRSLTLDSYHNIYVTGHFAYTADFDPGPGTHLLTATGNTDGYIMKLDPLGNLLWVSMLYSSNQLQCCNLVYDGTGSIYICGSFNDTVDFDPGPGFAITATDYTFHDGFVAKYDTSGNYIWSGIFGSLTSHELGYDVAMDPTGKLIVCGKFRGPSDFDIGAGNTTLIPAGSTDGFVVKYDPSGNLVWAWQAGGTGATAECFAMAIDPAGNIYCSGNMQDTVDFDNGPGTWLLETGSLYTGFVVRIDSSGVMNWAGIFEGTPGTTSSAVSIAMDSLGTILYTGGAFEGTTDFDPNPPVAQLTSTSTFGDAYIQKMICVGPSSTESISSGSVQLFPNPSNGEVTLQMGEVPSGPVVYCIYDATGRLVASESLPPATTHRISLHGMSPGIYSMQVAWDEGITTFKLVLNQ